MEFCPHCRRMVPTRRRVVDLPGENERHIQTVCAVCLQVIFEAVRPLDEEEPALRKRSRPDLNRPIRHRHRHPRPRRGT